MAIGFALYGQIRIYWEKTGCLAENKIEFMSEGKLSCHGRIKQNILLYDSYKIPLPIG